jgi:hypothetical protein
MRFVQSLGDYGCEVAFPEKSASGPAPKFTSTLTPFFNDYRKQRRVPTRHSGLSSIVRSSLRLEAGGNCRTASTLRLYRSGSETGTYRCDRTTLPI